MGWGGVGGCVEVGVTQESLSLIRVESDLFFDAFLPLKEFICAGLILLVRYKPLVGQFSLSPTFCKHLYF